MPKPFRFTVAMPALRSDPAQWRAEIRRVEDLGFSSVAVSDHFTDGWAMDPIVAMTVAALVYLADVKPALSSLTRR